MGCPGVAPSVPLRWFGKPPHASVAPPQDPTLFPMMKGMVVTCGIRFTFGFQLIVPGGGGGGGGGGGIERTALYSLVSFFELQPLSAG